MDFDSKRMALLAGVGDPEVRHEIVREQAEQLNETIESRKSNDTKDPVRLAVRKAIQKMIAEGTLNIDEDAEDVVAEGDIEECGGCGEMHAPVAPPPACPMSHDHEEQPHNQLMMDQPPMLEEDEAEEDESVSEGDDAVISENEAGDLTLELGGKIYELHEILSEDDDVVEDEVLEEVDMEDEALEEGEEGFDSTIPDEANRARVGSNGKIEYSQSTPV